MVFLVLCCLCLAFDRGRGTFLSTYCKNYSRSYSLRAWCSAFKLFCDYMLSTTSMLCAWRVVVRRRTTKTTVIYLRKAIIKNNYKRPIKKQKQIFANKKCMCIQRAVVIASPATSKNNQFMLEQTHRAVAALLDQKLSAIIKSELHSLNLLHDEREELVTRVGQNITLGVVLGEEQVINVMKLMFRNRSGKRRKEVGHYQLIKWMESQSTKGFIQNAIVKALEEEIGGRDKGQFGGKYSPRKKIKLDERGENQKLNTKSKESQLSPSSTQHSSLAKQYHQNHVNKLQQRQDKNEDCNEESMKPSPQAEKEEQDLFEVLNNQYLQQGLEAQQSFLEPIQSSVFSQNSPDIKPITDPIEKTKKAQLQDKKEESNHQHLNTSDHKHHHPQAEPYTLMKLTDLPNYPEEEESNLMSEVSSFQHIQSYRLCHYQLEDTQKYGHLLYGDKIDKILRSFSSQQTDFMLIRWLPRSTGFLPFESILQSECIKVNCPEKLIEYYEKKAGV